MDENILSDVTIVMPCFNEGNNIVSTIQHLKGIGFNNILIIDDGSHDDTYLKATNEAVFVLRNKNNIGFNFSLLKGLYEINTKYTLITRPYHQFDKSSLIEFIYFGKKGNYSLLFSETKKIGAFSTSKLLKQRYGIMISEPLLEIAFINEDLLNKIKTNTINNDFILYELIRIVIKNNLKLGTYTATLVKTFNYQVRGFIRNLFLSKERDDYLNKAFPKEYKENFD